MTEWLLTHQPLLIAIININAAAVVALVIGISFKPSERE